MKLAVLQSLFLSAAVAVVVEHDFDLLMMESGQDGPAVTIVEAPREMFQDNDEDVSLEMESRMASPERSYVDEDQFVMAANYLKSQFSVPHHLVPSYQDISKSSLMKRRLSHLPNIENHRFDPNISPYDVPKIEDFKKPPEVYKRANIYRMDNSASGSQSRLQRVKLERNEQRKVRPQRRNFQLPNREQPPTSGFLSNLLNPFNPFRKPSPPAPDFGPIPDRFKYPLPSAHQKMNGKARPRPGNKRNTRPDRSKVRSESQSDLKPKSPAGSRPFGPPRISERRIESVKRPEETSSMNRRPTVPLHKPFKPSATHSTKTPSTRQVDKLRRRTSSTVAVDRRKSTNEAKPFKDEKIDGLPVDFWVDEVDVKSSTSRPDYRTRWRNLTREHEDKIKERKDVKAEVLEEKKISPVFSDWGDTFWDEIHDDWGEEDEDKFADLSARYLHAWADVARIGTRPKPNNIQPSGQQLRDPKYFSGTMRGRRPLRPRTRISR